MTARRTPGKRLVALLNKGLATGVEWDANELAVLGLVAEATDRIESLKVLLAAELAKPEVVAHRCAELSGEIRQTESAVVKWISSLQPEPPVQAKSVRHQDAARARWGKAGLGGPA